MNIWLAVMPELGFLWHRTCLGLSSTSGALLLPVSLGDRAGDLNVRQFKDSAALSSALQLPPVLLFWEVKGGILQKFRCLVLGSPFKEE